MKVSFKSSKRMVTDYYVYIDGVKFELFDTLATLRGIEDRCMSIVITDKEMARILKENDVIEFEGNRRSNMGARFGTNGKKLLAILEEKEDKIYKKVKK